MQTHHATPVFLIHESLPSHHAKYMNLRGSGGSFSFSVLSIVSRLYCRRTTSDRNSVACCQGFILTEHLNLAHRLSRCCYLVFSWGRVNLRGPWCGVEHPGEWKIQCSKTAKLADLRIVELFGVWLFRHLGHVDQLHSFWQDTTSRKSRPKIQTPRMVRREKNVLHENKYCRTNRKQDC